MPPPTIRLALPSELDAIFELGVRSKMIWKYSEDAMETFRGELRIPPSQIAQRLVFVLIVGELLLGYYAIHELSPHTVELQHLFIDPLHLRQGHGSRLLTHAIGQARAGGYRRLVIQSDPHSAGFYQAHGIPKKKDIPSSIPGRTIPYFEITLKDSNSDL